MRIKRGSIALILIQLFVFSAMVGALSPTVSATNNEASITTSNPEFPELPLREDVGFDRSDAAEDLGPEFVPGEVLVKFRTSISTGLTSGIVTTGIGSIDELNEGFQVKEIKKVLSNVYKLTLPKDADVLSVVREYEADPNVEYAQPNYIYHYFAVPNDAEYWRQWAHEVTQVELAWNITTGDPSIVITILDSGVDYDHPDLAANIWVNPGEDLNGNGIVDPGPPPEGDFDGNDTDGNGYIDDIRGWDFIGNDNDPLDKFGHGTHCAGIAAAVANNDEGVAGVSWHSKIMPVRISPTAPYSEHVAPGIRYATNNGANIISMSFGFHGEDDPIVHNAVLEAFRKQLLLVAAAGNEASSTPEYPAAWPEVMAVSATDTADNPATFTNFGDWIEVAAPGVDIYSTIPRPTASPYSHALYDYISGTSMAAPYVAGLAALTWSKHSDMNLQEVRFHLREETDDLGDPGFDQYYGYGRVNARWALERRKVLIHDLRLWGLQTQRVLKPGYLATINSSVLNIGERDESEITVQLLVNGSIVDNATISLLPSHSWDTVEFSWTPTQEGWYNVTSHVVPAEDETFTDNNVKSARVLVRDEEVVRVPEDFSMIQRAVSAVNLGYRVQVSSGTYHERVYIDKSLTLIGEGASTTIIDGGGVGWIPSPPRIPPKTVHVYKADNVHISQFTMKNSLHGVELENVQNATVCNNIVSNNTHKGVYVYGSHNLVSNNTISNNSWQGVNVIGTYNSISGNTMSNSDGGVYVGGSHNLVSNNTISNNYYGVCLSTSYNNKFYHNNFIDNTQQVSSEYSTNVWDNGYPSGGNYWSDYNGTDADGDGIGDAPYEIDQSNRDNYPLIHPWGSIRNADTGLIYTSIQKAIDAPETLDGHTIEVNAGTYYEHVVVDKSLTIIGEDPSTTIIDSQGEGVATVFVSSNNVTITGFTIKNSSTGIWVHNVRYTTVSDNVFSDNDDSIYLQNCSKTTVSNNTMLDNTVGISTYVASSSNFSGNIILNTQSGIKLFFSSGNNISSNVISYGSWGGVIGLYSDFNNIRDNIFSDFTDGVDFNFYGIGVLLTICYGNSIIDNTLPDNDEGICLDTSRYNNIVGNTIYHSEYPPWGRWTIGIHLESAHNNTIYHNNFRENLLIPAGVTGYSGGNIWDDGYPSGGNYWGRYYKGVDNYSGPYQNETGSDGIGDIPFDMGGAFDNYPLMHPWGSIQNIDTGLIYLTIQRAIDAPETSDGHTIEVDAGTYHEHVVVDKSLMLIGKRASVPIIDGNGMGNVVTVQANNVHIIQFTIQNGETGIYLNDSSNNIIHHNNFINNTIQAYTSESYNNVWWCSANHVGNYWSDYSGPDNETYYGIGDTPYVIDQNNQDSYPLMWKWFPGDIDGDSDVDDDDYNLWLEAHGTHDGDPGYNPIADLNYDGSIGLSDFFLWRENKGKSDP